MGIHQRPLPPREDVQNTDDGDDVAHHPFISVTKRVRSEISGWVSLICTGSYRISGKRLVSQRDFTPEVPRSV